MKLLMRCGIVVISLLRCNRSPGCFDNLPVESSDTMTVKPGFGAFGTWDDTRYCHGRVDVFEDPNAGNSGQR